MAWLRANVAEHGGDPDRIVLVGSSAGATHIASYAAMPELHPDGEPGIRGLVLLSGAYDLPSFDDEAVLGPYFGDRSDWEAASPLAGLVDVAAACAGRGGRARSSRLASAGGDCLQRAL